MRKRLPGETPTGPEWKQTTEITNSAWETIPVNEYFAVHPEMMLGEMRLEGRMYTDGEPTLVSNGRDLAEQLAEVVALLPQSIFQPATKPGERPSLAHSFPSPEHVKPNAYTIVNGQIAIRDDDRLRVVTGLSSNVAGRIRGMIRVRDAVRRCLLAQVNEADEAEVVSSREMLNQAYDYFVGRFGPISERANMSAFRGDPDQPLLLSLENYNEETRRATKAAIFRERTIQKKRPLAVVNSPEEALLVTLNERGCVDLDYLASRSIAARRSSCRTYAGRSFSTPKPIAGKPRMPTCPAMSGRNWRPPRRRCYWTTSSRSTSRRSKRSNRPTFRRWRSTRAWAAPGFRQRTSSNSRENCWAKRASR